jgi:nucleoside-diphosphate-sugar epimerase
MKVLVAGGSGVLGRPAVAEMRASGHDVVTLGRSAGNDARADLLDRDAVMRAVDGRSFDVVVHAATALSGKSMTRHRDMADTDALRTTGTPNLVAAARATGARRLVGESMVFGYGYGDHGEGPLTEAGAEFGPRGGERGPAEHVAAMRAKEELILGSDGIDGIALRFGLFYGAGVTDTMVVPMLRKRALPVVNDTAFALSWVDVTDAAHALALAVTAGRPGQAYNIADERPVSFGTHVRAVAEAFGTPRPLKVPRWVLRAAPLARTIMFTQSRMDSTKAAAELDWRPTYAGSLEGVRALAAARAPVAA